jgi:hypothetical protein
MRLLPVSTLLLKRGQQPERRFMSHALWPRKWTTAAIVGGVITYAAGGAQKVAVTAGFTDLAWPTKIVTARVIVLGLDDAPASQ